jgi:hypothetical protein
MVSWLVRITPPFRLCLLFRYQLVIPCSWIGFLNNKGLEASINAGVFLADYSEFDEYEDTFFDFLPRTFYGSVQFIVGTDMEYEPLLRVSRAHANFEVGEWYLAHQGGVNFTDSHTGLLRVATVMVGSEKDRTLLKTVGILNSQLYTLIHLLLDISANSC